MSDGTGGSLYPVAVLIDEIKHEDVSRRLVSMKSLTTIAQALGADRTRSELVPFLNESLEDEDEVLLVLAEQLGGLVGHVGGGEHAHHLLPPLEQLCAAEETTVRDKGVEAVCAVVRQMADEQLNEHYFPLVRRLVTRDWFTARISACGLFTVAYRRFPASTQQELRRMFAQLCRDDTPMVRRGAAAALGPFAKEIGDAAVVGEEITPLFLALAEDDQDSVRLLVVDNCCALCEILPPATQTAQILPVAINAATDRSWRVRWAVSNGFCRLCEVMGTEVSNAHLVSAFERLLKDTEAEVRTAAAFKVTAVAKLVAADKVIAQLVPCVTELSSDSSEHVRSTLAGVIMGLAPIVGRQVAVDSLLPLFLQLLRDGSSEVRLNIISKMESLDSVVGVELLTQSLLPAIVDLSEDRQWRVRLAIIEYIPLLAGQLGMQFFDERLSTLCMGWLTDSVFSIREAAAANLKKLCDQFGLTWTQTHVVPRVVAMCAHTNYLYRLTSLHAVQVLSAADVLTVEVLSTTLLPLVLRLATDPVANIRFNVAKTLQSMVARLSQDTVSSQIRPCLDTLLQDADRDVQYYANKALQQCAG